MAEAQVVARAKAHQNYCQKIKSPRKSRSLTSKNNGVLEVLELPIRYNAIYNSLDNANTLKARRATLSRRSNIVLVFLYGSLRFLNKLRRKSSGNSPSAILLNSTGRMRTGKKWFCWPNEYLGLVRVPNAEIIKLFGTCENWDVQINEWAKVYFLAPVPFLSVPYPKYAVV